MTAGTSATSVPVREAAPQPCPGCPWLTVNHGRRHPDGWYTAANARRLWAKLRTGDSMTCHATDPGNPVSDRAHAAGQPRIPTTASTRECAGALILQQREVMWLQSLDDFRAYRQARRRGLTREGLGVLFQRALLGGSPLGGGPRMAKPDLNTAVSVPGADLPWPPPEQTRGADPRRPAAPSDPAPGARPAARVIGAAQEARQVAVR